MLLLCLSFTALHAQGEGAKRIAASCIRYNSGPQAERSQICSVHCRNGQVHLHEQALGTGVAKGELGTNLHYLQCTHHCQHGPGAGVPMKLLFVPLVNVQTTPDTKFIVC